jgi:hypothetical protein
MLLVGGDKTWKHPIVLTEFGGIAFSLQPENTWGYSKTHTAEELLQKYNSLLSIVRSLPALAGFCYTQFTDTYQEANGLLYADRTPKVPFSDIALATSGTTPDQGFNDETVWRDRLRHSD